MNKYVERIYNCIWKENPLLVLVLGTCPTLAVTTSAINGMGMGLSTTAVLVFSNMIIAALRKLIPDRLRLPAEIVIVASLVTIVDMLMAGFTPSMYESLGVYIPLIVVNCIILGRAESFAMKNGPVISLFDGIGMGLGFTIALIMIGAVRELIGAGTIFLAPSSFSLQAHSLFMQDLLLCRTSLRCREQRRAAAETALHALQQTVKKLLSKGGDRYDEFNSNCDQRMSCKQCRIEPVPWYLFIPRCIDRC